MPGSGNINASNLAWPCFIMFLFNVIINFFFVWSSWKPLKSRVSGHILSHNTRPSHKRIFPNTHICHNNHSTSNDSFVTNNYRPKFVANWVPIIQQGSVRTNKHIISNNALIRNGNCRLNNAVSAYLNPFTYIHETAYLSSLTDF